MLVKVKGRRSKTKTRTPAAALADISLKDDRLVGTTAAAQLLGLQPKTLREWRCKRTGPAALKLGSGRQGRVCYRLSTLEAWVKANVTSVTGGDA
jgi:hypothetical protein